MTRAWVGRGCATCGPTRICAGPLLERHWNAKCSLNRLSWRLTWPTCGAKEAGSNGQNGTHQSALACRHAPADDEVTIALVMKASRGLVLSVLLLDCMRVGRD